jgi:hypothetical protein
MYVAATPLQANYNNVADASLPALVRGILDVSADAQITVTNDTTAPGQVSLTALFGAGGTDGAAGEGTTTLAAQVQALVDLEQQPPQA